MKIILPGLPPSKKNSRIIICRASRPLVLPSKNYQLWRVEMLWLLKKYKPIRTEIASITATFFCPTKRLKWDLSNKWESVGDILVDADILPDDSVAVIPRLTLIFGGTDRECPRVEVDIV